MRDLREENIDAVGNVPAYTAYVDDLVEGYIRAHSACGFGDPTIAAWGLRTEVVADRIKAGDSIPVVMNDFALTAAQVLAAICFEAGRDWQRSRKRRQRMSDATAKMWVEINQKQEEHDAD